MSIKLVDSLQSMGDFPVAFANSIECADGTDLETKLSTLGTGGGAEAFVQLSQEEYDNLEDSIKLDGREFRTYDTGHIYQLGVEFGKETDISGKQDNLSQVKFTMRRNSVSEGRYCLIGSSDLSQNLLMCEPYRFQGIFGDGTTSVENKSIIDFMVSFREGVENPDDVLSGFANSSKGFDFVDLLITADETTNMAYAYVDFKVSGAVATGEITKPVLEAESYMDFAESFELTENYIGTLVCKMSDYAKIISNDTNTLQFKTTDITDVNELWRENGLYIFNTSNVTNLPTSETSMGYCVEVVRFGESESSLVVQKAYRGNPNDNCPIFERRRFNATWTDWVGIPTLSDTSSTTSTYSSAKIDEKYDDKVFGYTGGDYALEIQLDDRKIDIEIVDNCGGKIEILGNGAIDNSVNYRFIKVLRLSYGNWTEFDATKPNDTYTKIKEVYVDTTNKKAYVHLKGNANYIVKGAKSVISKNYTDVDTSTMTLIPESKYASINDSSTGDTVSTWSSSKIASEISPKADRQNAVRNTDYLKSDRAYLKIARNGTLSHVPYYACETYILCNHLGNMGALSFIRTDIGASCVYKDIVGTLSLSVEKSDEYICWLKYSNSSSEIITVYALNGHTPTVSAVTSIA